MEIGLLLSFVSVHPSSDFVRVSYDLDDGKNKNGKPRKSAGYIHDCPNRLKRSDRGHLWIRNIFLYLQSINMPTENYPDE